MLSTLFYRFYATEGGHFLRTCFLFYINYLTLFSLQCAFILQQEIQGESLDKGKFESCFNCSFDASEYMKYHIII